jgi:diguanylate cyclase (GGDEF)-like protein
MVRWPSAFVWKRTAIVTCVAAAISISLSTGVRVLIGAEADAVTIAVRLVLPFVIAIPLGVVWFTKLEKLETSYRELLKDAAKLAKSANSDPLTGLLNRRSFTEQFELAQAHDVRGCFLIADVDYLKAINDTFGHGVGDNAILGAAVALRKALPEASLIGRIGGDEFCAFVPQRDAGMEAAARNVNQIAAREFRLRSGLDNATLSMSFGHLACKSRLGFRDAMNLADDKLYDRKRRRMLPVHPVLSKSIA